MEYLTQLLMDLGKLKKKITTEQAQIAVHFNKRKEQAVKHKNNAV